MEKIFQLNKSTQESRKDSNQPTVSVIIISYNNVHYLYHAVKSVLAQSYSSVEVMISDDATVGCTIDDAAYLVCLAAADLIFERHSITVVGRERRWKNHKYATQEMLTHYHSELNNWMECNRNNYESAALEIVQKFFPHITKLQFRKNSENLGTVKHLKMLKKNASGKYIMFLAADDKLHDSDVILDMVNYFEKLPEDACVLASQCGMYDENLNTLYYYAVNDELKDIIKKSTPEELFAELTDWCIVPAAGTIYKKKTFDIYGDLDDSYNLK